MLTHNETMHSDSELRGIALEAALRLRALVTEDCRSTCDGAIVVKNAELFLKFLTEDNKNE